MTEPELRAGVAREIISPPKGIYLVGYGDRTKGNVGVHDDLTATALVLEAGTQCLALVACDLLCLNEFVVDRIRRALAGTAEVIMACSHTHAGPIAYADRHSRPSRRAYIDYLATSIARAVRRAATDTVPVRLSWGETESDIAVNRRERQPDGTFNIGVNPAGPVDRSVKVLRLHTAEGAPLATVVNLACHGTVLGPENRQVSADWIGAMRAPVEAALGGLLLFVQGATGDLNPVRNCLRLSESPWEAVRALGARVAEPVIAACNAGLTPLEGVPLRLLRREVWLPLEAPVTGPQPPRTYRREMLRYAGLPRFLSLVVDPLLNQRYPWRSRIEARDGVWQVPLRINAVRIGELGLVAFGAETFSEIGMAIKAAAPTAQVMFAGVSDGCIGYLPTDQVHAEGGPEVDMFPFFYRHPGRMAEGNAQLAGEAAGQALRALWGA